MNKPVFYIVFVLFFAFSLKAQENLVPNGSFEEYNWCPNSTDGYYINACRYWTSPTLGGSPDYFNACSTEYDLSIQTYLFSVPENYAGNQLANSGYAYCLLGFGQNTIGSATYAEYVQVQLTKQLKAGKDYEVSFFVHNPRTQFCINSVGILFTSSELHVNTEEVLPFSPQVQSNPDVFFCDTSKWYEVKGYFQASGNEEYLTIGIFDKLPTLKVTDYQGNVITEYPSIYLYIDDVSVIETEFEFEITNVFTPNGDGNNDNYFLDLKKLGAVEAEIYNRWGNVISKGNVSLSWDGTFNGKDCSDGVYFIRILFENKVINGFIHLIR